MSPGIAVATWLAGRGTVAPPFQPAGVDVHANRVGAKQASLPHS
jgi:hypothetical protein